MHCENADEINCSVNDKHPISNHQSTIKFNMIPDLQISLLCDDVKREKNGKFILIGLFDNITVAKLPAKIARMCVLNRWCAGDGVFKQRTRIFAPDGLSKAFIGNEVEINHNHRRGLCL